MDEHRFIKLKNLQELNINPYINSFKLPNSISKILQTYNNCSHDDLINKKYKVTLAGRIFAIRNFGKTCFLTLKDRTGTIQVYVRSKDIPDLDRQVFNNLEVGDFSGFTGFLFKTKTGELTLCAETVTLLTKALKDLPEKWHGLKDTEKRLRQRYLDILVNEDVKNVFIKRSRIVHLLREFFIDNDYLEVETPMMQPLPGGATANPFETYHNALDMKLYLRIAPELYLKRLVIGGLEKVFEINRNFRNEGISSRHNPEFTMVEWYTAYCDYNDLMDMTENLINFIAIKLHNSREIVFNEDTIDLTPPWPRLSLVDSIGKYTDINVEDLYDLDKAKEIAKKSNIELEENITAGKIIVKIFEKFVEEKLIKPTFVVDYPKEVSPLAKAKENNKNIAERFELYIGGMEIANGFNELNDPNDQRLRFEEQVKNKEDKEVDYDYIRALEYGLPPTAGEGLGVDRLVMLFTNKSSIRDVILFPQLKKEDINPEL
jgi:lysyl-tRNA synthetase class 2